MISEPECNIVIVLIYIYTDGGCRGNPGPGGWAYVIIQAEDPQIEEKGIQKASSPLILAEDWGAEQSTTNNRMELQAVIAALVALHSLNAGSEKATVYTDSQYVQKGMTIWLEEWKKKGWKTRGKEPVKNRDLWQRLDGLAMGFSIIWLWVKGHAGNKYNERCDVLVQKAIASLQ